MLVSCKIWCPSNRVSSILFLFSVSDSEDKRWLAPMWRLSCSQCRYQARPLPGSSCSRFFCPSRLFHLPPRNHPHSHTVFPWLMKLTFAMVTFAGQKVKVDSRTPNDFHLSCIATLRKLPWNEKMNTNSIYKSIPWVSLEKIKFC